MFGLRPIALLVAAVAILAAPAFYLRASTQKSFDGAPLEVATAYLRALYARDLHTAYSYLSSADKRIQSEAGFIGSRSNNAGFALRLARRLTSYGEVRPLSHSADSARARIEIAYSYPAQEDLARIAYNWNERRLDSLTVQEQDQLLKTLAAQNRAGKLVMVNGRETFDLVEEADGWKIFLNWASGLKVRLSAADPSGGIEARFAQREMIVNTDAPFQINLTLKNTGNRRLEVSIVHKIEPKQIADELMMIECGLSQPVSLEPGVEREFTMAYLLSENARPALKELQLSYILRPRANG